MNDTNSNKKRHLTFKRFFCGNMGHRINDCHNKKAAEENAKVSNDGEKEQVNEKLNLQLSTSQTDPGHVRTIVGKTFFAFTKKYMD